MGGRGGGWGGEGILTASATAVQVIIEAKRFAPFWNASKLPIPGPNPLLSISGCVNLTIMGAPGAVVRMHKKDYLNTSLYPLHNEWRYGIYIAGSSNITIVDLEVRSTGGDGIAVAWMCQRVTLLRVTLDDNYRNALTLTAVSDFTATSCVFSNTFGTAPNAGVDLEPDQAYARLENVRFENCSFLGNHGPAFQMAPGHLVPFKRGAGSGPPALQCVRASDDAPPCPISVSLANSVVVGRAAGAEPVGNEATSTWEEVMLMLLLALSPPPPPPPPPPSLPPHPPHPPPPPPPLLKPPDVHSELRSLHRRAAARRATRALPGRERVDFKHGHVRDHDL